jgi:hypothetical protein
MEAGAVTMVPGYRHHPGNHCGSTAIRNLLGFHGVEMTEEMAFGLGAGACFYFVPLPGQSPSRFTNGRTSRLEEQFVELTGAPLDLETFGDADASWAAARERVAAGTPVLVLTDLYYLDHYGKSAHFPGHAIVIAGFDADKAYVSDTGFEELQATSLDGLAEARHAQHPVFPLSGHMFTVGDGIEEFDPAAAIPAAIARCAERMLAPPLGDYEGLPGLRQFAAEVGSWPELLDDLQWSARFNYQVIERRGTGGGNFRAMYSRFLGEAEHPLAEKAAEASARWTALAGELQAASEDDEPQPARWQAVGDAAAALLEAETELWEGLAG